MAKDSDGEVDLFKLLTAEMVETISAKQKATLDAIGARLSEVGKALVQLDLSLQKAVYIAPIQHTAHLAMESLIKSMRGPHDAAEVAVTAWKIAEEMHKQAEDTLSKFAASKVDAPELGDAEAHERRDTERPGAIVNGPSDNGSTLRVESPRVL